MPYVSATLAQTEGEQSCPRCGSGIGFYIVRSTTPEPSALPRLELMVCRACGGQFGVPTPIEAPRWSGWKLRRRR